jgi:predicted glycosyltransferase
MRELDPALDALRIRGRTLCILGLRDVLDEPQAIEKEWMEAENEDAVRNYYDAVWIYGDRSIYHAPSEYNFSSDLMAKARFTGYHDQRLRLTIFNSHFHFWEKLIPELPYVLCLVGGGQDGALLAETFVRSQLPPGMNGVLITGPYMPESALFRIRESISKNPRFIVLDFLPETVPIMKNSTKVISMGGYNTVCEILSFEKPALIVPRVLPRKEQLIRAQRFQQRGLLEVLHWDNISPDALSEWMSKEQRPPVVHGRLDFNGLHRIQILLRGLVENAFGMRSA